MSLLGIVAILVVLLVLIYCACRLLRSLGILPARPAA